MMNEIKILGERIKIFMEAKFDHFKTWPEDKFTLGQLQTATDEFFDFIDREEAIIKDGFRKEVMIGGGRVRVGAIFYTKYDPALQLSATIEFELNQPTISGLPPKRFKRKLRIEE